MLNRRSFLTAAAGAAAAPPGFAKSATKRDRMLAWVAGKPTPGYTPAAFFLHFAPEFKDGPAAAKKHLEFFRQTDMDFVKIQFEQTYKPQPQLQAPADWAKVQPYKLADYEPLLVTVRDLVKAVKREALIVMTLYSPYMSAGHCATKPVFLRHLEENPDAVKRGLEILTESQLLFVRACIKEGVDGFYMSTQGSETGQLSRPELFTRYVKPFDLVAMKEAASKCPFNILHVCDYHAPYASYDAVLDYPGQVVNVNPVLKGRTLTAQEITAMFKRPFMGGLDRHGLLEKGSAADLDAEIRRVLSAAPRNFMLGADCTVAGNTDWTRLRQAIAVAHGAGTR